MSREEETEGLDQFDFCDEEEIEKQKYKYSNLIGRLIIDFSMLEHALNLAIAEALNARSHLPGYLVIEKVRMLDKIDLFRKIYFPMVHYQSTVGKKKLIKLVSKLKDINAFRNEIAHANWGSLSKDGFVRTRIKSDKNDGYVNFQRVKITPSLLRQHIKEVEIIRKELEQFSEKALGAEFGNK